jgi:hypothetical protein
MYGKVLGWLGKMRCFGFATTVAILLFLMSASLEPIPGRSDPLEVLLTGKISHILYLSAVLKRDPLTDAVVIPTRIGEDSAAAGVTSEEITRYMRLSPDVRGARG